MDSTSRDFEANVGRALDDTALQAALINLRQGFTVGRANAVRRLPEFEALRDVGKAIKDEVLEHLDFYLEAFERRVTERGGTVHWARTAREAREIIAGLCEAAGAKTVTKSKSMITEEIGLNEHLEAAGITPVETDLGEYIIQIRNEGPSHIIAPAIHLMKEQVADSFRATHGDLDPDRPLGDARLLTDEARDILRAKFLAADVGITGANMLVAETGSIVVVTNEGNADLTQSLPKTHIVLASIEKIVPTIEDAFTVLRLLARSATGQEFSTYTTLSTGSRRADDLDGPETYHVVLLDNGRTAMLGTEFQEMLRCIRCGACMNHCPVYAQIGGHAYGWVYPGPMGSVLTPALTGIENSFHLPNASTLCGRCESVCPMKIPLPRMLRQWREKQWTAGLAPKTARWGLGLWAFAAKRPRLYGFGLGLAARILARLGGKRGRLASLPLAGGWTDGRDLPAPEGRSFQSLWAEKRGASGG
jgi:L-lactate dehydrogenase complex protein LldF